MHLLLGRKRDANAALRRFLHLRISKAAPILEFNVPPGGVGLGADQVGARPSDEDAVASIKSLGQLNPMMEEKSARLESFLVHLRVFDAVRDRALWSQLDRLSDPLARCTTEDMGSYINELDRLLRTNHLTELAPLLRRALLTTWLLPDQVECLLDAWNGRGVAGCKSDAVANARQLFLDLPKYFEGPFLPHTGTIAKHLGDAIREDAQASLYILAVLGKRSLVLEREGSSGSRGCFDIDPAQLIEKLVKSVKLCARDCTTQLSASRKAIRVLALLRSSDRLEALRQVLEWAEHVCGSDKPTVPIQIAVSLAAACLEHLREDPSTRQAPEVLTSMERWVAIAGELLRSSEPILPEVHCAAGEVYVAVGAATVLLGIMNKMEFASVEFSTHAASSLLRSLHHGTTLVTTQMLSHLASQPALFAPNQPSSNVSVLVSALEKFQKPARRHVRLADRLRLSTTLPVVFAFAPTKQDREVVQRMLQISLARALHQSNKRQEPLLDYAIACFLHFLSRMNIFCEEVAATMSAFPESTRVSVFFAEALLRCDPQRTVELAGICLRVCDRVRYFVDKENPSSDAVHRAANVLRYVVEKRCPELGAQGAALQSAQRGPMPAQLFEIRRQGAGAEKPQGALSEGVNEAYIGPQPSSSCCASAPPLALTAPSPHPPHVEEEVAEASHPSLLKSRRKSASQCSQVTSPSADSSARDPSTAPANLATPQQRRRSSDGGAPRYFGGCAPGRPMEKREAFSVAGVAHEPTVPPTKVQRQL